MTYQLVAPVDPVPFTSDLIDRLPNTGHFVYFLNARAPGYDPEDRVAFVYVGVTSALRQRMRAHSRKWWWAALDHSLCYFMEHDTRELANHWEAVHIHADQPAMNRAGRLLVVG